MTYTKLGPTPDFRVRLTSAEVGSVLFSMASSNLQTGLYVGGPSSLNDWWDNEC